MAEKLSSDLWECIPELKDAEYYLSDCLYSNSVKPDPDILLRMISLARIKIDYYSQKYKIQIPSDDVFLSNHLEEFITSLHTTWNGKDSIPEKN